MRNIQDFFKMSWAVLRGRFPFPWKTALLALACLAYLLCPIDLIPDVLPVLGITDDATFILLVLALLKKDISRYRAAQRPPRENVIDIGDIGQHKK